MKQCDKCSKFYNPETVDSCPVCQDDLNKRNKKEATQIRINILKERGLDYRARKLENPLK